MNCTNCGTPLPQGAIYCPTCGTLTPAYYSSAGSAPNAPTVQSSSYIVTPPQSPPPPTTYGSLPYQTTPRDPYGTPPPTPYDPYQSLSLTPPPPSIPPRSNRIGLIIGVILLILLLVSAGIVALLLHPGARNASSTASPATTPVNTSATAPATAVVNPYTHSGTLAFFDPLSDNSKGHVWDVNTNCAFTDGAYHAIAPDERYGDYCIGQDTDFSNFVFEVRMQIIKGYSGGLRFRVISTTHDPSTNSVDKNYNFEIGQDGKYELSSVNDINIHILAHGLSPAIYRGLNQINLIAVIVTGNTISLYVNQQQITSVTDSAYSHGRLGFDANGGSNSFTPSHPGQTEVVYSNTKVWKL